jgi:rare lipoprotein A
MRHRPVQLLVLVAIAVVTACAGPASRSGPEGPGETLDGPPPGPVDLSSVPEPRPREEPLSRYGNPPSYDVFGRTYYVQRKRTAYHATGIASWYGTKFHGRRTSSGEPFDMHRFTAAHRTLPLPSYVEVTNLSNGRSLVVRVNDRGPFKKDRLIDLSYAAAARLGFADQGTARVEIRAVGPGTTGPGSGRTETVETRDASDRVWLQAGAFRDPGNAERLRRQLADAGLGPVQVQEARSGGDKLFRVRVGPLDSRSRAADMADRLEALGFEPPQPTHD